MCPGQRWRVTKYMNGICLKNVVEWKQKIEKLKWIKMTKNIQYNVYNT